MGGKKSSLQINNTQNRKRIDSSKQRHRNGLRSPVNSMVGPAKSLISVMSYNSIKSAPNAY